MERGASEIFMAADWLFFKSYTVDYPKAYHIQDLLIAQALGKKILDVNSMQSLKDIYPTNYILSPDFPFLLKVGFRYENYSLVFKEAKTTGLAFKLTPKKYAEKSSYV
eukprot:TRINITY_DN4179_c0_g1_i1.p3 TRINITY_DN4179_c0_g1~~TRINITY_DN4179_c0_g1_i1.p3  ORF type:complete len:108 (-),score=7.61 TRINITY_DN4179_c0_g1_i1:892-1215(-)